MLHLVTMVGYPNQGRRWEEDPQISISVKTTWQTRTVCIANADQSSMEQLLGQTTQLPEQAQLQQQ